MIQELHTFESPQKATGNLNLNLPPQSIFDSHSPQSRTFHFDPFYDFDTPFSNMSGFSAQGSREHGTWNYARRKLVSDKHAYNDEPKTIRYDREEKLFQGLSLELDPGFDCTDCKPKEPDQDPTPLWQSTHKDLSKFPHFIPLKQAMLKILRRPIPIGTVVALGLGDPENKQEFSPFRYALLNYLLTSLIDFAHLNKDFAPHQFTAVQSSLKILYQNSDWFPLESRDWKKDMNRDGIWYKEGVPLLASVPEFNNEKYRPTKIEACRDLLAFEQIDEHSIVVILDRRNPWRQMLGSKPYEDDTRPLAVICPPVGEDEVEGSRDYKSEYLESILRSSAYNEYPAMSKAFYLRNPDTSVGPCVGPLTVYIRTTLPLLPLTWDKLRRDQADTEAGERFMGRPYSAKFVLESQLEEGESGFFARECPSITHSGNPMLLSNRSEEEFQGDIWNTFKGHMKLPGNPHILRIKNILVLGNNSYPASEVEKKLVYACQAALNVILKCFLQNWSRSLSSPPKPRIKFLDTEWDMAEGSTLERAPGASDEQHGRMATTMTVWKYLRTVDTINEETFVIVLNPNNPWRQILGRKLTEGDEPIKPALIICAPVEGDGKPGARDERSLPLAEVLKDSDYSSWPCKIPKSLNAKSFSGGRNGSGELNVTVGPWTIYVRKDDQL